jgi:hypothetical protein
MDCSGLFASISRVAFVTLLTMLLDYGANGQIAPEPRTLSGTLYYAGGNQPAEHVNVELHSSEGNIIAPQTTSSTGWFEFRGLPRGTYVIAIRQDGFEPINLNVDMMFNSSRGNVIYLTPRQGSAAKPPDQGRLVSTHELSMPQRARELMVTGKKNCTRTKMPGVRFLTSRKP